MPAVIIIGAGAAGCFAAIELKRQRPDLDVVVLEAHSRPLAKVAVTGGGRCNLTNTFASVRSVKSVYPRGDRLMKRALRQFSHHDTIRWFEREGVQLAPQADGCIFPASQDAMQIVNTLLSLMRRHGVRLLTGHRVTEVRQTAHGYTVHTADTTLHADSVLIATGGKKTPLPFPIHLADGQIDTVPCVPSLFTFTIADPHLHALMGTVVESTSLRIASTRFQAEGPLLITHWGFSGPATLRLSSYAARHLADHAYTAPLIVNWLHPASEAEVLDMLRRTAAASPTRQLASLYPDSLCQRLWLYIIGKVQLAREKRWGELGPRQMNRLAAVLTADSYTISGRGQFKDEFVTCGGIALDGLNPATLECRRAPGLHFAGEALDIDALTGGFNLQAAWTTAHIAARSIAEKKRVL